MKEIIALIKAGERETAFERLREYLATHPDDFAGWVWMSEIAPEREQQAIALRHALRVAEDPTQANSIQRRLQMFEEEAPVAEDTDVGEIAVPDETVAPSVEEVPQDTAETTVSTVRVYESEEVDEEGLLEGETFDQAEEPGEKEELGYLVEPAYKGEAATVADVTALEMDEEWWSEPEVETVDEGAGVSDDVALGEETVEGEVAVMDEPVLADEEVVVQPAPTATYTEEQRLRREVIEPEASSGGVPGWLWLVLLVAVAVAAIIFLT